jgi:hypothetical protein
MFKEALRASGAIDTMSRKTWSEAILIHGKEGWRISAPEIKQTVSAAAIAMLSDESAVTSTR